MISAHMFSDAMHKLKMTKNNNNQKKKKRKTDKMTHKSDQEQLKVITPIWKKHLFL